MEKNEILCPVGHGEMELQDFRETTTFRDIEIDYTGKHYVCQDCGLEVAVKEQMADIQKKISDTYRYKTGLLPGEEIKQLRKKYGVSQKALADKMTIGIASIKRWENGIIQSKSMDQALRYAFLKHESDAEFTGNRDLSIPRIKLVVKEFESKLARKLLKKGDKFLFTAKYLWYADMVAFRNIGKSMTGATYAALTYGPQLNNYRDLIDVIKDSDISVPEPLSDDEKKIIAQICKVFPKEQMVYDAAHREPVWKNTSIGHMIPYSKAYELTEI